jgi:ethanolamine utilization protein EutQ (cupin superfamily)
MDVNRLAADDVADWSQVGEGEIFVSDRIDLARDPDAEMTVGFARVASGEKLEYSFPYDEVLVVTKGAYTVHTADGKRLKAGPGELIYLPAGTRNSGWADEDAEIVYVASPPSVYAAHVAASAATTAD